MLGSHGRNTVVSGVTNVCSIRVPPGMKPRTMKVTIRSGTGGLEVGVFLVVRLLFCPKVIATPRSPPVRHGTICGCASCRYSDVLLIVAEDFCLAVPTYKFRINVLPSN